MAQTDLCAWCGKLGTSEAFSLSACDEHWPDLSALLSARLIAEYLWVPGRVPFEQERRSFTSSWYDEINALNAPSPASSESETHRTWEALPAGAP